MQPLNGAFFDSKGELHNLDGTVGEKANGCIFMSPFYGVFIDSEGNEQDLKDFLGGGGPGDGPAAGLEELEALEKRVETNEEKIKDLKYRVTVLEEDHSGGSGGIGGGPIRNIRLEPRSIVLEWFQDQVVIPTYQLFVLFSPPNADNKLIFWQSDNENVATVDDHGLVTAVAFGNCNIIATSDDGGFTDIITCEVIPPFDLFEVITLNENGSPTEFEIIHRNLTSSLYQGFQGGIVLGRKFLLNDNIVWSAQSSRFYHNSIINPFLNDEYIKSFDQEVQDKLMTVRIPVLHAGRPGGAGQNEPVWINGSNGLLCKSFILGLMELGLNIAGFNDGVRFPVFEFGTSSPANLTRRKWKNENSQAQLYWTRTSTNSSSISVSVITASGVIDNIAGLNVTENRAIFPVIVLPATYINELKKKQAK